MPSTTWNRARPHPAPGRDWDGIAGFYERLLPYVPVAATMLGIVRTVQDEAAADRLLATTSMHDLLVTPVPAFGGEVFDFVRVGRPQDRFGHPAPDGIAIEHRSATGRTDRVVRPECDAVPLFWRFMIEKFGVHPARDS